MKRYLAPVAVLVALLITGADNARTSLTKGSAAGAVEPTSVPGSINRGNAAIVKPGYIFIRRGAEVDVVRVNGRFKTGTYMCRCRSGDANQRCELQFSPKQIYCKQGSCTGTSCQLVPVEPASIQ